MAWLGMKLNLYLSSRPKNLCYIQTATLYGEKTFHFDLVVDWGDSHTILMISVPFSTSVTIYFVMITPAFPWVVLKTGIPLESPPFGGTWHLSVMFSSWCLLCSAGYATFNGIYWISGIYYRSPVYFAHMSWICFCSSVSPIDNLLYYYHWQLQKPTLGHYLCEPLNNSEIQYSLRNLRFQIYNSETNRILHKGIVFLDVILV